VCKHPDWWVKIADFGISKRATEELIAPRTSTGTHDFAAPEVLGFTQSDSYTNAIDIWSLGLITFLILTGETLFTDQLRLNQYVIGSFTFPSGILLANEVSEEGCEFVKNLMALEPEDRLEAAECLQNPWLACLLELAAPEIQRYCVL
jgi:serine/threonine protein kinase